MHTPDQKPKNRLWTLFTSMLTISSFTFGGGVVIVSLMKRRFVAGWTRTKCWTLPPWPNPPRAPLP